MIDNIIPEKAIIYRKSTRPRVWTLDHFDNAYCAYLFHNKISGYLVLDYSFFLCKRSEYKIIL